MRELEESAALVTLLRRDVRVSRRAPTKQDDARRPTVYEPASK